MATAKQQGIMLRDDGPPIGALVDRYNAVVGKADKGDAAALTEVRGIFDREPRLWKSIGDLGQETERRWIAAYAGEQAVVAEALARQVAAMRADLAGPSPSPLEALLVERVVACWVHLNLAEHRCAARLQESAPLSAIQAYQNWLDRAQKRYLQAIKTLATVRRLQVPVLIGQLNIAGQQVNLAGSAGEIA